ncbi:MAG: alkaline phosphatase family protein, partial [Planctomycetota bacterium]
MSRKIILVMVFFALLSLSLQGCGAAQRGGRPQNIILIGWDGAQRNHVKECLKRGELDNLKKLSGEGALVAIDILRVTDTKAGWAQILTGYEPEVTGVFSNRKYQPIPKGYTVFERLEEFFGAEEFVTAAVIGKKNRVGAAEPRRVRVKDEKKNQKKKKQQKKPVGKIVVEDGVKYRLVPGEPYFYTKESMDVFVNDLKKDERVGLKALELLERYKDKPFFFFV